MQISIKVPSVTQTFSSGWERKFFYSFLVFARSTLTWLTIRSFAYDFNPNKPGLFESIFFLDGEKGEGGLQFDSSLHISRRTNLISIQVSNWSTGFLRLGNSLATVFISHGYTNHRSSHPELFLGKAVLKMCFATLLKSHFGIDVLLEVCCIFSEQLFLRTPMHMVLHMILWMSYTKCTNFPSWRV